jgi:hypothetical protein
MGKMLKARTPGLERPDTIIRKTIHHMGSACEKKYYMHWVLWHWPEIVGDFIARNTSPQGIRKDTLYIYSDNSALRNELQMMMPQIVQSVNNYAGQKMIEKVAFPRNGRRRTARALMKSGWHQWTQRKILAPSGARFPCLLRKCSRPLLWALPLPMR